MFELEIARGLNRGSFKVQLAPREAWVFERFVGTNLTAMWRWLRTGPVDAGCPQNTAKPCRLSQLSESG
jgi:hypothetical protein